MARLLEHYQNNIVPQLLNEGGYNNPMQVPKLVKITLNMGLGEATSDKKVLEHAMSDMALIAGQCPAVTRARKSIAGFKIREDWPIGCRVTLRKKRMYEFLDRFISIAVPRIRDFRGLNPRSFDGQGNYSMGITEQLVFPEVDYDKIDAVRGLDVTFVTSARNDVQARALLDGFGFPFRK